MHFQWYPGHMTKARRMMQEDIKLIDIVIELVDARIPYSSKNPDLDTLAKNKHRILLLNKCDLADERATDIWQEYFEKQGFRVIRINALKGNGLGEVTETARSLMKEKIEKLKARGRINVPIRSMIVGIPNVGKSTFINKYVGKVTAKTGDKPGVTRGKQWISVDSFDLMDMPGVLWKKFDSLETASNLAFIGSIRDDILDIEELACGLLSSVRGIYPQQLLARYKLDAEALTLPPYDLLQAIGAKRGMLISGGEVDTERAAKMLVGEFRASKWGRLSLERPPHRDTAEEVDDYAEDDFPKDDPDFTDDED